MFGSEWCQACRRAVNYGSGRRAYDPMQTVAGKTGTCIGQGAGSVCSFARATQVTFGGCGNHPRNRRAAHFPAAVCGTIYRELNHRFGTPTNMQVANTLDDEGTADL